jgi:hypothetical protein
MSVSCKYCVFSGRRLCDGADPLCRGVLPGVCVIECDQVQQ